ncbi:MAG: DUF4118 domain-containing protein [Spirochaetaceae bacterium]|nr:DUF4118 domain-containing protein [Spirochaetaceae bacterium]MCF7948917.1 DUF4118 domain-containing protein [Spirochaetia bacterium]MCF7951074.1 DUF4118 domain-containing protein [Spirochaetaceae bacterium]
MNKGKLKIFFGYADGSGKTYTMLQAALRQKALGFDVVLGSLSPHTRPETFMLAQDLEFLSIADYPSLVEAALARTAQVILIDDLCSNQTIINSLLSKGYNIYTTLNVYDLEMIRKNLCLPSSLLNYPPIDEKIFAHTYQLEFIDIEPEELLKRFVSRKIYADEQAHQNRSHLFDETTLSNLRQAALEFSSGHTRFPATAQEGNPRTHDIRVLPSSEYLLVCISPALSSRRVIQVAARAAKTVNARLVAVHVETRRATRKTQSGMAAQQLRANLQLAEQLGAEVVIIQGRSIAGAIAEYASMRNIHRIAIGREQARTFPFSWIKADTVQKLLQLIPWAEIQVIPGFPSDYRHKHFSSTAPLDGIRTQQDQRSRPHIVTFLKPLLLLFGATLLAILFDTLGLSEANIIMVFLLGVVLVSLSGGRWIGVASSIVSVMLFNFLFTEPRYTFVVSDPQYLVIFPVLFIVALITSELVNREKREAQAADVREQRTEVLYRISRSLLQATGTRAVIMAALEHLSGIFNVGMVVYVPKDNSDQLISYHLGPDSRQAEQFKAPQEKKAAEWSFAHTQPAGSGTDYFCEAQGLYFPIQTHNRVLGVLGVDASRTIPDDSRNSMLEAVAAQIALALDRENLAEAQENSRIEIERERLRSNLLRAISHDLRTPLASITGSSSTLLYDWEQLNNESRSELLKNIQQDAAWLTQLIENLLSLAKVEGTSFVLNRESELVDDIVAGVLSKVRTRATEHHLKVELPEDPLFVPADVGLVQQVLINLLDNALRYTPKGSTIFIQITQRQDKIIEFRVSDNGPGIPPKYREKVFDRFFTLKSDEDQRRGLGLGLSICKSIIEIHQGTMELAQSSSGGAEFIFTFPAHFADQLSSEGQHGN